MKSKTQKSQDLKKLKDKLPKSKITIFTTFSRAGEKGLSVAQMRELKNSVRGSTEFLGGLKHRQETTPRTDYFVTKKSLIEKALKDLNYDGVDVYGIIGSMGVIFSDDDAYAVSKKVYEFSRKNPALQFFGALFENNFLDKEAFLELAKMPSREVLIGRLVGMLTYPIRGLAVVMHEVANTKV